ncbi:MAG: hypothetical protein R3270_04780 [Gammaproteobacteria bacterium]|nr:hypothetical protein [Gammaproteobacteria bacterium]
MSDKEQFLHNLSGELDAMERQIDAIEADVRAEHPKAAEEIHDKLKTAKARTFELKEAAEHEWEERKEKAHSAWQDLKEAFSQVRSRLGD